MRFFGEAVVLVLMVLRTAAQSGRWSGSRVLIFAGSLEYESFARILVVVKLLSILLTEVCNQVTLPYFSFCRVEHRVVNRTDH